MKPKAMLDKDAPPPAQQVQRLDKWLWFARFFKTREEAAQLCESRHLRLDGRVIDRAHANVRVGNLIAFPKENRVVIVRVKALAERRGPTSEAQGLYENLNPLPLKALRADINRCSI
jgi:ribosome-associated heat shock protein Hsp15